MRVAVLSDWHIGPWEEGDPFGHDEAEFIAFLEDLEASHDLVVVLGDVYQTQWAALWHPAAHAEHLLRARLRLPALAARLDGPRYVVLAGNHDEIAARVLGWPRKYVLEAGPNRAVFCHGHEFDVLMTRHLRASRASTWLMGWARRLGLAGLAETGERWDVAAKHRWYSRNRSPYHEAARRLAEEHGAQVVCLGHTHVPELLAGDDYVYANPGACLGGRRCHVSLDFAQGTVELHCDGTSQRLTLPPRTGERVAGPLARVSNLRGI